MDMTTAVRTAAVNHEAPMFRHAVDALYWAYSRRPVIDTAWPDMIHEKTETGEVQLDYSRAGFGMSPLPQGMDGVAQAGMILALVQAMPNPFERQAIQARYGRRRATETLQAMIGLIPVARGACGTGAHHYQIIDGLVQRHFGRRVKLKDLAYKCSVHVNTVSTKWRLIQKSMFGLEARALDRLTLEMQERGLLA